MLEKLDINEEKNVALFCNFHFFFDAKIEGISGSPVFKKKSANN